MDALVCQAWKASFGRKENNRKAAIQRGWHFLDCRLLKDPDILRTKVTHVNSPTTREIPAEVHAREIPAEVQVADTCSTSAHTSELTEDGIGPLAFNLAGGEGSLNIILDLIQYARKNYGIQQAMKKRKEDISALQVDRSAFDTDKRFTAGSFWKGGGCLLNGDALVERRRREDISIQKVMNAIDKTANMYKDRLEIYQALVDKGDVGKQTVAALRLWLQVRVKPKSGGAKIPTDKPTLLELKAKYAHSVPLTLSEYLIDAKPKDKALVLLYLSRLQQPADGEATVMEGLDEDFAQLPSADI